eukprot:CAMPEP_0196580712 /NCGR_PEP_ID=MMETSP1081-20130531/30207_1 /TAXON_ID=36882 /ORGANISM="Pyramimonas amylifera, Strain CCMP720" /LENGTH=204 /DNA_ID=CAMNT_0041900667 /DNA_START=260 /DNA_END=874 /DNA_ORIENTATION=+
MAPPVPSSPSSIGHHIGGKDAKAHLTVYLDYCCPYSAIFYKTFFEQVVPHYGPKLLTTFYHQVQPWHAQSIFMHEAALAATMIGGDEAFWKFSAALMDQQAEYFDVKVDNLTRLQVCEKLADLAATVGVDKAKMLDLLKLSPKLVAEGAKNPGNAVTQQLKFEIRASRQMSIHVSPTTTLNGILYESSSSYTLDKWKEILDPVV